MVEAAEATATVAREAYQPIAEAGVRLLDRFTRKELETILQFARGALELQQLAVEERSSASSTLDV